MTDLLTGLALVFVIEGLILAIFPDRLRWLLERMAEVPPEVLRAGGLISAAAGVFAVWLLRG
ncbi:MAG: DUF2065 domain-containing protein [Rhodospirillales bacterium]|nr:DUF2065 domain-containing protein [Rhodospirillales bacterium]